MGHMGQISLCDECILSDGRCTQHEAFKPVPVNDCGDFIRAGMNPARTYLTERADECKE